MTKIGDVIKELRKRRGISQAELSFKCGLSPSSLSQIENNIKKPHQKNIEKLCSVLGITEPILYVMAISEDDLPIGHKESMRFLLPIIRQLAEEVIKENDSTTSLHSPLSFPGSP